MNHVTFKLSGIEDWMQQLDESRKSDILHDIHSDDFTDFFGRELCAYEFQQGLGLCGILLPTGHFLKCHDRQHNLLADLLNENEKFLGIYFSSRLIFDKDQSVFTLHLDNTGGKHTDTFIRDRVLANLQIADAIADPAEKTIITQSQVDFIQQHYRFMNQSQQKILCVKFLKTNNTATAFKRQELDDDIVVIPI